MAKLFEKLDSTFENQLNEGILGNLAKAGLMGTALIIGKGIKWSISKGISSSKKKKLESEALRIKNELNKEINKRVNSFKEDILDDIDDKLKNSKLRAIEKDLTSYVKKKLSLESKRIENGIDKSKTSDNDKLNLKFYWENLSSMLELDIMESLRKQNIIDQETVKNTAKEKESELTKWTKTLAKAMKGDVEFSEEDKKNMKEYLENKYTSLFRSLNKNQINRIGEENVKRYSNNISKISETITDSMTKNDEEVEDKLIYLNKIIRKTLPDNNLIDFLINYEDELTNIGVTEKIDINKVKTNIENTFNWFSNYYEKNKKDINIVDLKNQFLYGQQDALQKNIEKLLSIKEISHDEKINILRKIKNVLNFLNKLSEKTGKKYKLLKTLEDYFGPDLNKLFDNKVKESFISNLYFVPLEKYII